MAEQGSAPPLGVCPQGSPLLEATPCSNPSWQCQSSQSSPRSVKLTNYDRNRRTLCVKDYLMNSNVNINHLRTKDFLLILWWRPFKMWFLKWLRLCSSVRINNHTVLSTPYKWSDNTSGKTGGGTTWTGYFKWREVKTGFCRNRSRQTGSSGTLIGWESGQTNFVPLWDRMERGYWLRGGQAVRHEREISNAGR